MTFAEELKKQSESEWTEAVQHRFVQELYEGKVDRQVMAKYLVMDYRFVDHFLSLIGMAIASADKFSSRLRFSHFAGFIAADENTYFVRACEKLGVTEESKAAMPDNEATKGFKDLMEQAADTRNYAAILSVLYVAEALYYDWGRRAPKPLPEDFVYAEWITLHDYPGFRELVEFLGDELNRVGPSDREIAAQYFTKAVKLEKQFFDQAYQ